MAEGSLLQPSMEGCVYVGAAEKAAYRGNEGKPAADSACHLRSLGSLCDTKRSAAPCRAGGGHYRIHALGSWKRGKTAMECPHVEGTEHVCCINPGSQSRKNSWRRGSRHPTNSLTTLWLSGGCGRTARPQETHQHWC